MSDSEALPRSSSSSQLSERLRKTIQGQRSPSPGSPTNEAAAQRRKMTLEERLKASLAFSIGDASGSTTPTESRRPSPAPPTADTKSPVSTPLPDSPEIPLKSATSQPEPLDLSLDSQSRSPTPDIPQTVPDNLAPEPTIINEPLTTNGNGPLLDVDALQDRLQLMERKFVGLYIFIHNSRFLAADIFIQRSQNLSSASRQNGWLQTLFCANSRRWKPSQTLKLCVIISANRHKIQRYYHMRCIS